MKVSKRIHDLWSEMFDLVEKYGSGEGLEMFENRHTLTADEWKQLDDIFDATFGRF